MQATTSSRCAAPAQSRRVAVRVMAAQVKPKIFVQRNVPAKELAEKNVRAWPTWGCGVSKFPWTYSDTETCYITEGTVVVTPEGGEPVEIKAGDLAVFPVGLSCTWDVKSPISKHYDFS